MYVKQLAKLMGVTADTVRHYTRIGLLHPIRSEENGYQEYTKQDQQRLKFIISSRQLGFSQRYSTHYRRVRAGELSLSVNA